MAAACTDRVALLVFTSGTLGTPKAVMLSHAALANLGRVLAESRRTAVGDVVQGIAPLSHIMGVSNLMSAMHAGATLQLMPRLEMAELAAGIQAAHAHRIRGGAAARPDWKNLENTLSQDGGGAARPRFDRGSTVR